MTRSPESERGPIVNCPLCVDQTLDITYHGGIEIDICPKCRGVWLDRGELEKLAESKPAHKSGKPAKQTSSKDPSRSSADTASKSGKSKKKKKKKKKSLGSRLGDVLEDVLDL
jgi:hypothetical protein